MDKNFSSNSIKDNNDVGLGVDIVDIKRMSNIISQTPNFIEKNFTKKEIDYCKKSTRYVEHFSTHFAAKEAVLKALGYGFQDGTSPNDIEVGHDDKGKPFIILSGKAKVIADEKSVLNIPISLSFTNTEAVAVAIAITQNNNLSNDLIEKNKNSVSELTQKFKEAKKILDDEI